MKRFGKEHFVYLGIFLLLILFPLFDAADSDTFLNIPNSPPELIEPIPNQSWPGGTNLTEAFDLDDYFQDAENNLTYYYTFVNNITVSISANNTVSFYPDPLFLGTEIVNFIASDGTANTTSNDVYLFLGTDIFPPQWSNPAIDRSRVYQGATVGFSVDWWDNFNLSNYTFQLEQEGIWSNFTGALSGSVDTAQRAIQITSSSGKIVRWKGCASDEAGNSNCTDIYEFDVLVPPVNPEPPPGENNEDNGVSPSTKPGRPKFYEGIKEIFTASDEPDFSFNVNAFAVSLKQGESKTRILEITNTGNEKLDFNLSVFGLEENIQISEEFFQIVPGETKTLTVDFFAPLNSTIGEYFGSLIVNSFREERIPLTLIINDVDLDFQVLITVLNKDQIVKPGKEVMARLDIENLKDQILTEATLQYAVKDFEGNIYNSAEEEVSFEYSLSLERSLEIPDETPIGPYIFYARLFNEKENALNSALFDVGTRFKFAALVRISMIFLLVVILSFVIFFLMIRYKKQVDKGKALNLYVKLNEMRDLIKNNKFEEAANLYIGIKKLYGERVPEDVLKDKVKLAEVIKELSGKIDFTAVPIKKDSETGEKGKEGETAKGEESESKGERGEKSKEEPKEGVSEEELKEEKSKVEDSEKPKAEGSTKKILPKKTLVQKKIVPKKALVQKKILPKKPAQPEGVKGKVVQPQVSKKKVVSTIPVKKVVQKVPVKKPVALRGDKLVVPTKKLISVSAKKPLVVPAEIKKAPLVEKKIMAPVEKKVVLPKEKTAGGEVKSE